jgi:Glycosyl hydrolase family 76
MVNKSDVRTWAVAGFKRFKDVWKFDDFWTRGNTFEACLRFVMAAQAQWGDKDQEIQEMGVFLKDKMIPGNKTYISSQLKSDNWADDFGWWGIACLTARDYLQGKDSDGADAFLEYAKSCWSTMRENGYDPSEDAKPVPHGCGNSGAKEVGTKNTVTNANLLILCLRLYDALKSDKSAAEPYIQMSYNQFLWFSDWFDTDADGKPKYDYLRLVRGRGGLVQERPHASPDYESPDRPEWEPGWVWTGDQGLVLGALAGILSIKEDLYAWARQHKVPNFDPAVFEKNVQSWRNTIGMGVKSLLFCSDNKDSDHVLREPPFKASFEWDAKDYVCGRGVLFRYLSELERDPSLYPYVEATAKALWENRDKSNNQFHANWTRKDKDDEFNRQFKEAWGEGDEDIVWNGEIFPGILQATGLDVLAAAIRAL